MSAGATLRATLRPGRVIHAPGVSDAVGAALVRELGFDAAYLSGATVSATALGLPDLGFVHASDVVAAANRMLPSLGAVPLVADADTGYGNAVQARRTVRQYAAAGVGGLHIEDQVMPKRCGHMAGKAVVPLEEAVGRIRAAKGAGTEVVVIARTDVLSIDGLDAATERAAAFACASADLVFVEGACDAEQLAAIGAACDGVGLVLNRSEAAGDTDGGLNDRELAAFGVRLVIHPVAGMLAAAAATRAALLAIRNSGHSGGIDRMTWQALTDLLGLPALLELEAKLS